MSHKTSENLRLSKVEHEFEQKYYTAQAGVDFREYLMAFISSQYKYQNSFGRMLNKLAKEKDILEVDSKENLANYENAKKEFNKSFNHNKEAELPEDILKLCEDAADKSGKSVEMHKRILYQKALCVEFESFIKKLRNIY